MRRGLLSPSNHVKIEAISLKKDFSIFTDDKDRHPHEKLN